MKEDKQLHHLWDKLFKVVGNQFPEELLRFVWEGKKVKYNGHYEQDKVVIEHQIADINFWVNDGTVKKLLNIEPYSNWDEKIPGVVFTRNGIITKSISYQFEVISIVILLEKRQIDGLYQVSLEGKVLNQFHFPVIDFHDIKKILKEFPPLAPFVLKVDPSYEKEVLQIVKGDKLLTAITILILNKLGKSQKEALEMTGAKLDDFKEALLDVPIMKDLWDESKTQGINEGKENQIKDDILKILKLRFNEIPSEIHEKIKSLKEQSEFHSSLEQAVKAENLAVFEAFLNALLEKE